MQNRFIIYRKERSRILILLLIGILVQYCSAEVTQQDVDFYVPTQCAECSYDCFAQNNNNLQFQCEAIAKGFCKDLGGKFNFFQFLYCDFKDNLWAFMPVAVIIIYLIFKFISATVEEYIAGGITYLSEEFGMSEAMAAVTLLALANGAGDVITAIVASGTAGGVSYNIGSLYGAGFFVCSFVIALTILKSPVDKPIVVDKSTIFRDIGFYVLSTVVTIAFAISGSIYWYSAMIFLIIYLLMVLVVYFQDRVNKENDEREKKQEEQKLLEMKTEPKKAGITNFQRLGQKVVNQIQVVAQIKAHLMQSRAVKKKMLIKYQKSEFMESMKKPTDKDMFSKQEDQPQEEDDKEVELTWEQRTVMQKVDYTIEFPFDWIRKVTMPPSDQDNYDKTLCIIWPFPGTIFILFALDLLSNSTAQLVGMIFAIVTSGIFYATQRHLEHGQIPKYFMLISIIGTLVGLLWTYVLSEMLIGLLNLFVVIFKLDNTFMGLTILGIGNALPDALTTIALAGKGYAQMGITGSYAGQLFGLLIGFGIAQMKETLSTGIPSAFPLFTNPQANLLDIIVIFVSLFNLIVTAVYALRHNFMYKRTLAYICITNYCVFFVAAVAIQIWYLIDPSVQ